ncbi:MAG: helix-turn-helix transcriptional regulator [Clostridiales bacterium]|nr:helix-turn-helix transcriptional regulator [Clostridiales bacterium]
MSQAGIAKWETGDRTLSMDCLIMLAKFFKVTIDYLVGLED